MVYFRKKFILDAFRPCCLAKQPGEIDSIKQSHQGINVGSPDGAKLHHFVEIVFRDLRIFLADEISKLLVLLPERQREKCVLLMPSRNRTPKPVLPPATPSSWRPAPDI